MRNKFISIVLLMFLAAYPIYANAPYTIILNGMTYTPKHTLLALHKTLYISADDFSSLTYSTVTSENKTSMLNIQNHVLKLTPNERIAYVNGKITILANMPLILNEQLYLPVNLLNYIDYSYILNDENFTLTLNPLAPYSKTNDSYDEHLLINTKIKDLPTSLKMLIPQEHLLSLLAEAKKNNDYIGFVDNTDKEDLFSLINSNLLKGKSIQVAFREIDLLSDSPKVSDLKQMPVKLSIDKGALIAKIGEDVLSYNCIWAAYMPSSTPMKIDASKSLDATLMRMLYEYYRDQNDLKDDLYFSPVVTIKNTRSNSVYYTTYSDHLINNNVYDVIIYKTINENQITYTVDFILHPKK